MFRLACRCKLYLVFMLKIVCLILQGRAEHDRDHKITEAPRLFVNTGLCSHRVLTMCG